MDISNFVPFGKNLKVPHDVFQQIYATLELTERLSLYSLDKYFYRLLRGQEVHKRAETLKDKTFYEISKEAKIYSLKFNHKEIDNLHTTALHTYLKGCAKAYNVYQQKAFFYDPCGILGILNQMFDMLKIENNYQGDNKLEDSRLLETSSFGLKHVQGKWVLETPSRLSSFQKRFKLVFKSYREKVYLDSHSYRTKTKWHYWITLKKADENLMNIEELKLRIAIEMCFNSIVRMLAQLNQGTIPKLLQQKRPNPFLLYPVVTCNKYGLFLKSEKITMRCAAESLNEFENFALKTSSLAFNPKSVNPFADSTIDYHNAEWMKKHTFKSAFRAHVIDYTFQKYNKNLLAASGIKQQEMDEITTYEYEVAPGFNF